MFVHCVQGIQPDSHDRGLVGGARKKCVAIEEALHDVCVVLPVPHPNNDFRAVRTDRTASH